MSTETKCPFSGGAGSHTLSGSATNAGWWPKQLNLKMLHQQSAKSNPIKGIFILINKLNISDREEPLSTQTNANVTPSKSVLESDKMNLG